MTVKLVYQEPGRPLLDETESKLFSREDLESLTKEEIIHLYADSHIFADGRRKSKEIQRRPNVAG